MRTTLALVQTLGVYDIAPLTKFSRFREGSGRREPIELYPHRPSTRPSTATSMPQGMKPAPAPLLEQDIKVTRPAYGEPSVPRAANGLVCPLHQAQTYSSGELPLD